jgi:hypothetical protein
MTVALARRFRVDVSTDNTTWIRLGGITDLNPTISNTNQSADDYDTNGFASVEKTAISWVLTIKALRKVSAGYVFDAGQEIVRAAQLQFGDAARVYVRWYDRNGGTEAFSGRAVVGYSAAQTGVTDLDAVTLTLSGDGILTTIPNPYQASGGKPVVTSVSPAGQGAGKAVLIVGSGFTGATAVSFGGTNASDYSVQSDQSLTAVLPAGSAGATAVVVTTAAGASVAFTYTRAV